MSEVTRILSALEAGDPATASDLFPLIYEELRRLAAQRLAQEAAGHTLQATALVHEVYLRLVDTKRVQSWDSRRHFFAAAAEAMRRILVENARRKKTTRRGGGLHRVELDDAIELKRTAPDFLLQIDAALEKLAQEDPKKAELVKLRYFAGLSHQEAARALGISRPTADRYWAYAKARLYCEIFESDTP